jgi:type II secretory pathway component PulF
MLVNYQKKFDSFLFKYNKKRQMKYIRQYLEMQKNGYDERHIFSYLRNVYAESSKLKKLSCEYNLSVYLLKRLGGGKSLSSSLKTSFHPDIILVIKAAESAGNDVLSDVIEKSFIADEKLIAVIAKKAPVLLFGVGLCFMSLVSFSIMTFKTIPQVIDSMKSPPDYLKELDFLFYSSLGFCVVLFVLVFLVFFIGFYLLPTLAIKDEKRKIFNPKAQPFKVFDLLHYARFCSLVGNLLLANISLREACNHCESNSKPYMKSIIKNLKRRLRKGSNEIKELYIDILPLETKQIILLETKISRGNISSSVCTVADNLNEHVIKLLNKYLIFISLIPYCLTIIIFFMTAIAFLEISNMSNF